MRVKILSQCMAQLLLAQTLVILNLVRAGLSQVPECEYTLPLPVSLEDTVVVDLEGACPNIQPWAIEWEQWRPNWPSQVRVIPKWSYNRCLSRSWGKVFDTLEPKAFIDNINSNSGEYSAALYFSREVKGGDKELIKGVFLADNYRSSALSNNSAMAVEEVKSSIGFKECSRLDIIPTIDRATGLTNELVLCIKSDGIFYNVGLDAPTTWSNKLPLSLADPSLALQPSFSDLTWPQDPSTPSLSFNYYTSSVTPSTAALSNGKIILILKPSDRSFSVQILDIGQYFNDNKDFGGKLIYLQLFTISSSKLSGNRLVVLMNGYFEDSIGAKLYHIVECELTFPAKLSNCNKVLNYSTFTDFRHLTVRNIKVTSPTNRTVIYETVRVDKDGKSTVQIFRYSKVKNATGNVYLITDASMSQETQPMYDQIIGIGKYGVREYKYDFRSFTPTDSPGKQIINMIEDGSTAASSSVVLFPGEALWKSANGVAVINGRGCWYSIDPKSMPEKFILAIAFNNDTKSDPLPKAGKNKFTITFRNDLKDSIDNFQINFDLQDRQMSSLDKTSQSNMVLPKDYWFPTTVDSQSILGNGFFRSIEVPGKSPEEVKKAIKIEEPFKRVKHCSKKTDSKECTPIDGFMLEGLNGQAMDLTNGVFYTCGHQSTKTILEDGSKTDVLYASSLRACSETGRYVPEQGPYEKIKASDVLDQTVTNQGAVEVVFYTKDDITDTLVCYVCVNLASVGTGQPIMTRSCPWKRNQYWVGLGKSFVRDVGFGWVFYVQSDAVFNAVGAFRLSEAGEQIDARGIEGMEIEKIGRIQGVAVMPSKMIDNPQSSQKQIQTEVFTLLGNYSLIKVTLVDFTISKTELVSEYLPWTSIGILGTHLVGLNQNKLSVFKPSAPTVLSESRLFYQSWMPSRNMKIRSLIFPVGVQWALAVLEGTLDDDVYGWIVRDSDDLFNSRNKGGLIFSLGSGSLKTVRSGQWSSRSVGSVIGERVILFEKGDGSQYELDIEAAYRPKVRITDSSLSGSILNTVFTDAMGAYMSIVKSSKIELKVQPANVISVNKEAKLACSAIKECNGFYKPLAADHRSHFWNLSVSNSNSSVVSVNRFTSLTSENSGLPFNSSVIVNQMTLTNDLILYRTSHGLFVAYLNDVVNVTNPKQPSLVTTMPIRKIISSHKMSSTQILFVNILVENSLGAFEVRVISFKVDKDGNPTQFEENTTPFITNIFDSTTKISAIHFSPSGAKQIKETIVASHTPLNSNTLSISTTADSCKAKSQLASQPLTKSYHITPLDNNSGSTSLLFLSISQQESFVKVQEYKTSACSLADPKIFDPSGKQTTLPSSVGLFKVHCRTFTGNSGISTVGCVLSGAKVYYIELVAKGDDLTLQTSEEYIAYKNFFPEQVLISPPNDKEPKPVAKGGYFILSGRRMCNAETEDCDTDSWGILFYRRLAAGGSSYAEGGFRGSELLALGLGQPAMFSPIPGELGLSTGPVYHLFYIEEPGVLIRDIVQDNLPFDISFNMITDSPTGTATSQHSVKVNSGSDPKPPPVDPDNKDKGKDSKNRSYGPLLIIAAVVFIVIVVIGVVVVMKMRRHDKVEADGARKEDGEKIGQGEVSRSLLNPGVTDSYSNAVDNDL